MKYPIEMKSHIVIGAHQEGNGQIHVHVSDKH